MAVPLIKTNFTAGEVAPSLFGHVDLARLATAASTMRNMWPSYRGGAYSRAGTAFVGISKQTYLNQSLPPRLIEFAFSINQGLALEFGAFYMRVISNGAYVTETPVSISNITRANPAVMTASSLGASGVSAVFIGGVTGNYAPGDLITLAGGVFTTPTQLVVNTTALKSLNTSAPGGGYAPADTITLAGGVSSVSAVVTVATTEVSSAAIAASGTGGTDGPAVVQGTTGTGTPFQVNVTITAGAISAVGAFVTGGSYTVNPAAPANEPVTLVSGGAGLTGAALNLTMGVATVTVTSRGNFVSNPTGGIFTQGATSGAGTGATFANALMAPHQQSVAVAGSYTVYPANPVAQASTTGSGVGATFNINTTTLSPFASGDAVFLADVGGMSQVNGETYYLNQVGAYDYQLTDVYGNPIDSTAFGAYTGGGTAARIYTLPTIYAAADLPYLKTTESTDTMSLCCINQKTGVEYPPQDLARIADDNWTFTPAVPAPTVLPPPAVFGVSSDSGTTNYAYVVTSVSAADGSESIASAVDTINNAVDVAATAGTITVSWLQAQGAGYYNVYKATPAYNTPNVTVGALFGFAGSTTGIQFQDSNIVADFSQVPPLHVDPFARGQILAAGVTAQGVGYSFATATINTTTGSGAVIALAILNGSIDGAIVIDAGQGYQATDTVTIAGDGAGAAVSLTVGAQTGTYPGTVTYFQQRRAYAYTLNAPDTYFMSQPGSFTNFDSRIPTISSDAIDGSPWSLEVNGIQWMIPTSGGLMVMTGLRAWLLVGAGSFATNVQPISPASQDAVPQAFTGVSPTVPPTLVNYDILYVEAKGSRVYDLPYQLYALSEPLDLTELSSHLFDGYTILERAWCEIPNKLWWGVRSDGSLLSLTYYKTQQVAGWARHDTNGLYKSVCSVTEPPVDALYLVAERFPGGLPTFMIERMDNRTWRSRETAWCVDCGLTLPLPTPAATLTASSATGLGAINGFANLVGGAGYSAATTATIVDDNGEGPGTGGAAIPTIVGGVITNLALTPGTGYRRPAVIFSDPAGSNGGSGASVTLTLDNSATFSANAAVFSAGNIGNVIRVGGGVATVTAYTDPTHVTANITTPIGQIRPNSATAAAPAVPEKATAGNWSLAAPVTAIGGLTYLAGMTVTGLADGVVIPPTIVPSTGIIPLPQPATLVTVGLGFQAQLQSTYLEAGQPTIQGQRKAIEAATARLEASAGVKIGSNQVDGSTLNPPQLAPTWDDLENMPDLGIPPYGETLQPLYTGDVRVPVGGGYGTPGQVALQQDNPLPMQVLAIIPEVFEGDEPEQAASPRKANRGSKG